MWRCVYVKAESWIDHRLGAYVVDLNAWAVWHAVFAVPIERHSLWLEELVPVVDDATGVLVGFGTRLLDREVPAPAPGSLVLDGGVWTVAWPDSSDPLGVYVIDADDVEFSATWTRRRDLDVDRVEVVKANQAVRRASLDDPVPVTMRVETALVSNADADDTLAVLLPDAVPASHWQADKFTVHLDRAAVGYFPPPPRVLTTLHGLDPRHNPEGTAHWHGMVQAREVILEGDQARVDLTLVPARNVTSSTRPDDVFGPVTANVQFTDLDPAITYANVDPVLRWVDLWQVRDE